MRAFFLCALALLLYSCKKSNTILPDRNINGFVQYIIKAGEHYTDRNEYKPVETASLQFTVRFDSSAVYQSRTPANQYDINKLYGFSDNGADHHQFSARFGWRWSDGALRLFGYVYNEGKVTAEEISAVPIGAEIQCRIDVTADQYLFYCNENGKSLPRKSTTAKARGYFLYPYFGGDEPAPHEIRIWIKTK